MVRLSNTEVSELVAHALARARLRCKLNCFDLDLFCARDGVMIGFKDYYDSDDTTYAHVKIEEIEPCC